VYNDEILIPEDMSKKHGFIIIKPVLKLKWV